MFDYCISAGVLPSVPPFLLLSFLEIISRYDLHRYYCIVYVFSVHLVCASFVHKRTRTSGHGITSVFMVIINGVHKSS